MPKSNSPIRCFEGNAQPHEPFWRVIDAVEGEEPEIEINGYISEYSWLDDDITPKMFKDDLYGAGGGGPITIRLNSYGGDVIAASMMHSIIRDYPGEVTVRIDGVAASAATVVAVAGDKVKMQETAYFMIHDPAFVFFLAQINIDGMSKLLDSLKAVKEGIINAYETKTGLTRSRLAKLMLDESWMDANKAADLGFIDEVIRGTAKVFSTPANVGMVNALQNYSKVPPEVLQAIQSVDAPTTAVSSEPLLSDAMQSEAESLRIRISKLLRKENEPHA